MNKLIFVVIVFSIAFLSGAEARFARYPFQTKKK